MIYGDNTPDHLTYYRFIIRWGNLEAANVIEGRKLVFPGITDTDQIDQEMVSYECWKVEQGKHSDYRVR